MKQSVRDYFNAFTEPFEGHVDFMYCDVLGLVTTGRGNLIDPMAAALPLHWTHKDGTAANQDEIIAEWRRIKALQSIRTRGGYAYKQYATLWLPQADIDALCLAKLEQNEEYLVKRFADFEDWPADAQLGTFSMSWAMGPGFHFPSWEAAARKHDWATCAAQCSINSTGNPGVIPRNRANHTLFMNAAQVVAQGLCPDTLYYPQVLGG